MLPFLNKKAAQTGVIVKQRAPDEKPEGEQEDPKAGMRAAARDLHDAIQASDIGGIAAALQAAFELAESQPHEEADHSFDAQNIKAAGQE